MAFSILYNDDVETDLIALLTYINEFTKSLGAKVVIDPDIVQSVLLGMRQDFPHVEGLKKASVFKKIANFMAFFMVQAPIQQPFPKEVVGEELAALRNHQNAIIAFHLAIDSLDGAIIYRDNGKTITLENRIQVSRHSYMDIIEALCGVVPMHHLKMLAVFLEQLAYKSNPDCQYALLEM